MSVKLMSAIFETEFRVLPFEKEVKDKETGETKTEKIETRASTAKLVLLALADHANDFGESVYPSLSTLERKTGLSRSSLIETIEALKWYGLLFISDEPSRLGTNNYTINVRAYPVYLKELDEIPQDDKSKALVTYGGSLSAPALARPARQGGSLSAPESSLTIIESSSDEPSKKSALQKKDLPLEWQIAHSDDPVELGKSADITRIRKTWEEIVKYSRFDAPGWNHFDTWLWAKEKEGKSVARFCEWLMEDDFRAKQVRSGLYTPDGDRNGKYSFKAMYDQPFVTVVTPVQQTFIQTPPPPSWLHKFCACGKGARHTVHQTEGGDIYLCDECYQRKDIK